MSTVLTVGSFDLLHPDHLSLFWNCRRIAGDGGQVIVGVNSDRFYEECRGYAPVMDADSRKSLVAELRDVDETFVNDDASLENWIRLHEPDILVLGSDWATRDYMSQMGLTWRMLKTHDVALAFVPSPESIHSSDIRAKAQR